MPQIEKAQCGYSNGRQENSTDGRPGSVSEEMSAFLLLPGLRVSPCGAGAEEQAWLQDLNESPGAPRGPEWRTRTELGYTDCF